MSRYTSAYTGLIVRFKEIDAILGMAKDISSKPITATTLDKVSALCRSGIVLLSSHIEGYIENLGEIAIDRIGAKQLKKSKLGNQFRYYLSRDLINNILKSTESASIEQNLLMLWTRDSHIWDNTPHYKTPLQANIFIGDFINPNHKRIVKFFKRFGYTQFEHDMASKLQADYVICVNMINQVVEQRNKIAHGDTTIIGTPTDLEQMKNTVKIYCREADLVFSHWFKLQGCPIR